MEAYIDENGELLPSFYTASRWDILKSFVLTVVDCLCYIVTGGFVVWFAFWKSLYIITYNTIFGNALSPKPSSPTFPKETDPVVKDASSQSEVVKPGESSKEDQSSVSSESSDSSADFKQTMDSETDKSENRRNSSETSDRSEPEGESCGTQSCKSPNYQSEQ
ncbi:hypothetical protein NPIL_120461 [Nephila pilipes]|uniref:Uncharacterized protein n=1 Tax=Nephila pilipes TaxID=299642 RepID=A0A8X6NKP5_NEPPI|nr:hypothetical protein NPIL_120461 [Nephila pilipes]